MAKYTKYLHAHDNIEHTHLHAYHHHLHQDMVASV